jgi:BON domain
MIRHQSICIVLSLGGLGLALPGPSFAQVLAPASPQAPASGQTVTLPVSGLELSLLRSLQANPITAPYGFSTERRGAKIALRGRVGTKQIHDVAIQTAIALGVPVIDDLVIDTLAAHQAASFPYQGPIMTGPGVGYPSAGPSTGMGYPGAGVYGYGSLPYTYPQPLFGKLDDPFFGFEPPAIGYPPWWGALTARRLGPQTIQTAQQGNPQPMANSNASLANPPVDSVDAQGASLPYGTIEMSIDPRGIATLRGTVPTFAERITLGQKVAQTPGVSQVVNLLNVKAGAAPPLSDKPPPPPVPADLPALPRPPLAMPNEGLPIVPDSDPIGQKASKAISARTGLANQSVKVKVRDGVASLSGKVPTVYEAMLAFRAVQRTPGVREIEDRLEFMVPDGTGPNPLADKGRPEDVEPYLEAQIRRQVGDLAHIDRVRIQGDSLELKGTIDREEDRPRFDAIIRSMPILRGFRVAAEMPAESR